MDLDFLIEVGKLWKNGNNPGCIYIRSCVGTFLFFSPYNLVTINLKEINKSKGTAIVRIEDRYRKKKMELDESSLLSLLDKIKDKKFEEW